MHSNSNLGVIVVACLVVAPLPGICVCGCVWWIDENFGEKHSVIFSHFKLEQRLVVIKMKTSRVKYTCRTLPTVGSW